MLLKSSNFILFNKRGSYDFFNIENTKNLEKLNLIFLNWNLQFFRYNNLKLLKNFNFYNFCFFFNYKNFKSLLKFFIFNFDLFRFKLNLLYLFNNGFSLNVKVFFFFKFFILIIFIFFIFYF